MVKSEMTGRGLGLEITHPVQSRLGSYGFAASATKRFWSSFVSGGNRDATHTYPYSQVSRAPVEHHHRLGDDVPRVLPRCMHFGSTKRPVIGRVRWAKQGFASDISMLYFVFFLQ